MKHSLGEILLAFLVVALLIGWSLDHFRQAAVIDGLSIWKENMKKQIEARETNKTP